MGHMDLNVTSEIYIHDNIEFIKNELKNKIKYELCTNKRLYKS